MDWTLAFVIGMGVALVELLSRYRDEPLKVIATSQFAWIYLLLNGFMSIGAHAILLEREWVVIDTQTTRMGLAIASGLSAALILRARVFTARLGDEQVSIGPGYVVDQLLGIIDAQIDRRRALQRVSIVVEVMEGKDFDGSRIHASTMITGSRQNLSLQDQKDLANQIREVVDRKIPDQEKSYALGFILLDFMGEEFLEAVAAKLPSVATVEAAIEAAGQLPAFDVGGITETGSGRLRKRTWEASLPVNRAKVVRELLTGVPVAAVRARIVELLDSGQLGSSEDERQVLRMQLFEILGRSEGTEADKVFAMGFAVHTICDSRRFRDFFSSLREGLPPVEEDRLTQSDDDDAEILDVSMTGIGPEDSGSGRPRTGSHPSINLNAGPLPIAKDR